MARKTAAKPERLNPSQTPPGLELPAKPKRKPGPRPVAQEKLAAYGIEAIAADLSNGKFLRQIAREQGVSIALLIDWIEADPERSRACAAAREEGSAAWDNEALERIQTASDPFELAKAREIAVHLRWRAQKLAPRRYGEKLELSGQVDLTLEQVDAKLALLMVRLQDGSAA